MLAVILKITLLAKDGEFYQCNVNNRPHSIKIRFTTANMLKKYGKVCGKPCGKLCG